MYNLDVTMNYNEVLKARFNTYRNILRKAISKAKRMYYVNVFTQFKNNIKQTWKVIKETLHKNKFAKISQRFCHSHSSRVLLDYKLDECKRAWGYHPNTLHPFYPIPPPPPNPQHPNPLVPSSLPPPPPPFTPSITHPTTLSLILLSMSYFTTPYQSEELYHITLSHLVKVKVHNTGTMFNKYVNC